MLKLNDLTLRYGERTLIRHLTCTLRPGEHVAVVGANGCGKSTLLKAIAAIPSPVRIEGEIWIGESNRPADRARRAAWIPQEGLPQIPLRAGEFVMLGRTASLPAWARPSPEDREIVRSAMEKTQTTGLAHARLSELSGGERQRLALALALATGAEVLLLDEPTAHLDLFYRRALTDLIASLREKTVLTVLHDLDLAREYPRVLLFSKDGVEDGSPDGLLTDSHIRELFFSGR